MTHCSRRQVIKTFILGAAFSNVMGRSWSNTLLFTLQSTSSNQNGFMQVKLSDFPELAQNRGSVRISTSSLDPRTNKQVGLFPPVIINRGSSADQFFVMSAACTHEDCIVRRLDKTSNRMVCPCHGSEYLANGSVVQGPAGQSLRPYNFSQTGEMLTIEIPEVFYEISIEKVPSADRVKVSFLAFEDLTYELYFRESLDSSLQRVTFAISPAGALDQTQIKVAGDFASVFVERPGRIGFFEIAMQTKKV